MRLTPKNWSDFQQYKDRDPKWIKLHRKLLDDYEFRQLPLASRALAPMLWLLASEYENGTIDASLEKISFRLHVSVKECSEALHPLIEQGFFTTDDQPYSSVQNCTEMYLEKEEETEREKDIRAVAVATRPSDASFDEFWKVFPRRDGANPKEPARKQFVAAVKSGVPAPEIIAAAGRYCAECRTKGQIGTSYVAQALTWLRQKRWVDYPAVAAVEAAPEALIEIMRESDDWPRWAELYRQHKGKDPPVNQRGGWHFPREWADEGQAA